MSVYIHKICESKVNPGTQKQNDKLDSRLGGMFNGRSGKFEALG